VILVLLDEDYNPTVIYEADRPAVTDAIQRPDREHATSEGS
jgi:hypothetical protein